MSYPYPPPPPRRSGGAGLALGIIVILILGAYILFTDEVNATVSTTQTTSGVINTVKGLLPLSLANQAKNTEQICDLYLEIPTMISNKAFFGASMASVISSEDGKKLPNIQHFLDQSEWLYISIEGIPKPKAEWKNCYDYGKETFSAWLPLFNGQLASEKLSLLSFESKVKEIPLDPNVASQPPLVTFDSTLPLTISAQTDSGKYLVDKYNNGVFKRNVAIKDGLSYPVADTVLFTVENVKADDYNVSIMSYLPINEKRIGEPYVIKVCGVNGC